MPDLDFSVEGAVVVSFAATPQITFQLRLVNSVIGERVGAVMLHCQLRLNVAQRHYSPDEEAQLRDLFGSTDRWGQTLRPMLWSHAYTVIPSFVGEARVELPVPCTFDFNVAATKYFHALADGEIPLDLLFSGSVFYEGEHGGLQVYPVSWEKEATFRLPASTWRQMMDTYYPNEAWLTLRRDVFEQLHRYKVERGIPTWEQAFTGLLAASHEEASV